MKLQYMYFEIGKKNLQGNILYIFLEFEYVVKKSWVIITHDIFIVYVHTCLIICLMCCKIINLQPSRRQVLRLVFLA